MIETLRALDPTAWGTGLSPANARASWDAALSCFDPDALARPVTGTPPRAVLIVASRNVFTAPLEWLLHLRARGVRVLLKPARGQVAACRAMADAIGGVELREWHGGDVEAEARALAEVDAVIVFGKAETIGAIRRRCPPSVIFLGFGPRFGVTVVDTPTRELVQDFALYDGRGCMSPAAVFARHIDLDAVAGWMAEAEAQLPRGDVDPAEAAAIRARTMLARAVGERRSGPGWSVLKLPIAQFSPEALPRVLVLHPFVDVEEVRAAVAPWRSLLGTVATNLPGLYLGAPRMCAPGRMQYPPMGRNHDGVDVLGAMWR